MYLNGDEGNYVFGYLRMLYSLFLVILYWTWSHRYSWQVAWAPYRDWKQSKWDGQTMEESVSVSAIKIY